MKNQQLVPVFQALSESIRLDILKLLETEELCVTDITRELGFSQFRVSFHLKALKNANLIRDRKESRWTYYSLDPKGFELGAEFLEDFRLPVLN